LVRSSTLTPAERSCSRSVSAVPKSCCRRASSRLPRISAICSFEIAPAPAPPDESPPPASGAAGAAAGGASENLEAASSPPAAGAAGAAAGAGLFERERERERSPPPPSRCGEAERPRSPFL